jgi:asparagine synthase (glutamine-hydrolysing)
MCAIYSILNYEKTETGVPDQSYYNNFMKMKHRGPDSTTFEIIDTKVIAAHHRLAINGPGESGTQPIHRDGVYMYANAEIYNWEELYNEHGKLHWNTKSDCEIILELYIAFGMSYTCKRLRGEWAFMIYDTRIDTLFAARDCLGKRPLYVGSSTLNNTIGLASEAMALTSDFDSVHQFPPGHFHSFILVNYKLEIPTFKFIHNYKWFNYRFMMPYDETPTNLEIKEMNTKIDMYATLGRVDILSFINKTVTKAVHERAKMSDVPVGAYLSGGLDSSLVVALAVQVLDKDMHTFTIGLEGSSDIIAAKKVARFLGIEKNHHVVIVTMKEVTDAIPEVVRHGSTFDMTTIRCLTYQYLLSKYISQKTNIKVLLTGEGADEMCPGYFEFHDQFKRNNKEFRNLSRRRMKEIYLFDGLRSDRAAAAWGLEVRMPFLDEKVIEIFQNINTDYRRFGSYKTGETSTVIEKALLRDAFYNSESPLLPFDILYRPKHAFSDAINSNKCEKKSYELVGERAKELFESFHTDKSINALEYLEIAYGYHLPPTTFEAGWYRRLFNKHYPGEEFAKSLVPKFWLPNIPGQTITDPSATVLPGFKAVDIEYN